MAARILIVDDEAIADADLARALRRRGYDVLDSTGTAKGAIAAAREHKPDLVLMNLRLRGGDDRIEAARQIGSTMDIPVLFLTNGADEQTLARAEAAQACGYLSNPYDDAKLQAAVEGALHKHHQQATAVKQLNATLEQHLAERTEELARTRQELDAFIYAVAHDLRAPLRGISGYLDAMREDHAAEIPETARGYLHRGIECADRMQALMDDLLKLSRIARQELQPIATPLNQVVSSVVEELTAANKDRQIEWQIGELPTWVCDPGLIRHVFSNLLSNALKFTRRQPRAVVSVQCETIDSERVIVVRDNGVGFDIQRAGSLFAPFFRMHAPHDFEGTGVGLAIADRIIRRHGGRIWATAEIGKGATFYFTLGRKD